MEVEACRLLPPHPLSPKSIAEHDSDIASDVASIISSLESLPPPPSSFPPLDQLYQQYHQQEQDDVDACSDAATVQYDYDDMTNIDVVGIQRACADALTALLPTDNSRRLTAEDGYLATALSDLLEATYELETFHPSCSISSPHTPPEDAVEIASSPYHSLVRVLVSIQTAASKRATTNPVVLPDTPSASCDMHPAVSAVREELAWARVEACSQVVINLVHERDQTCATSLDILAEEQPLPPMYRRTERNSSQGSGSSSTSLPPYIDHENDTELVESAPNGASMVKPLTGMGDHKARQEEEGALEEAERRAAANSTSRSRMSSVLSDLDTVTSAIERLQSISQMQDQRVALRPTATQRLSMLGSIAPPTLPEPVTSDPMSELDTIMETIGRTHATDRLDDQRIDLAERRASRQLLVNSLQDPDSTLEADLLPSSADGNLARARDLREHGQVLNGLVGVSPKSRPAPLANGTGHRTSELSSPHDNSKVSHNGVKHETEVVMSPNGTGPSLLHKKQSNRRMVLYDDGPLTPQSSKTREQELRCKSGSLSPASLEFMFKELPLPPTEGISRWSSRDTNGPRRTSRDANGPRRSMSSSRSRTSSSPASEFEKDSTIRTRRAVSRDRSMPPIGSRSSSLARVPPRDTGGNRSMIGSVPMSPTFSDISMTSGGIAAPRGAPITSTIDEDYFHRLSTDSKVSNWSKASSRESARFKPKLPRSPSTRKPSSKQPSQWSGPRSPSSRSLTHNVDREDDLFDLLSSAASSTRMSNQEVELPTLRGRNDLTPKADWAGLDRREDEELPVTPRIVESVADGEWVVRLRDQEDSVTTPRSPYNLLTGSSLKLPEPSRSSRRNSFGSIITASTSRSPTSPTVASGGFKKFAASIKSSTLSRKTTKGRPPPLRTSGALDGSAVTYVTEHQEKLRAIQVLISGVDTTFLNTADLQLEVIRPTEAVLTSKSDATLRVGIILPSASPAGSVVHLQAVDDYLEAKLPAVPTTAETESSMNVQITHALSAPSLRALAPRSLCCTSCDRVVAHLPLDVEFKDLPSEYWAEMIEVWMCHADPAFTSQLAKHTSDGFWPSPDTVLVGGSYLLVSGSHICDSHLSLEKSNEPDQWRIVTCPCGEVLGKLRPQDGRPGAGTVRFSKWAIALLRGKGAGEISPVRYPVATFVVSDMLELSQAHASHRFIICDERTGDRRLAIWVFNPSIRVAYRRATDGSQASLPTSPLKGTFGRHASNRRNINAADILPPNRALRAAKIMFKVLDPCSPTGEYENLPGFGARNQVEHLRYSRDVCVTLIEVLRASAALYPTSRRSMGSFEVGFLDRV